jgi:RNA polymerase sigma-70 factor (ECF subfamily)
MDHPNINSNAGTPPHDGIHSGGGAGRGSDPRTDEQLLIAHRTGEPDVFQVLVLRYQRELYHFLVRFLGDRNAAEDIFQEAFLQVHQSADQFDSTKHFRPWLFTIAANKARDLLRAQSRRPTSSLQAAVASGDEDGDEFLSLIASSAEAPDSPMEKEEIRAKVRAVVLAMPSSLREVLLLSYFHQFPYKQIADMLGIPLGTVKSRLHSAVASFAGRWRRANPPSSPS